MYTEKPWIQEHQVYARKKGYLFRTEVLIFKKHILPGKVGPNKYNRNNYYDNSWHEMTTTCVLGTAVGALRILTLQGGTLQGRHYYPQKKLRCSTFKYFGQGHWKWWDLNSIGLLQCLSQPHSLIHPFQSLMKGIQGAQHNGYLWSCISTNLTVQGRKKVTCRSQTRSWGARAQELSPLLCNGVLSTVTNAGSWAKLPSFASKQLCDHKQAT